MCPNRDPARVSAVLLLLVAGCGPDGLAWRNPAPSVRFNSDSLDFAETRPGETSVLPLGLHNGGTRAATVALTTTGPFSEDRATLTLGVDGDGTVAVYFAPLDWADATGTLEAAVDGAALTSLPLTGPVLTDGDGDGAEAVEAGGTDCDDADPTVHPGAADVCADGVDADCSPAGDDDCDGDGYDVGVDCDDADPAVNPAATETGPDGIDQDCDGRVDEVLAAPGDLVLTELAPQTPAWIELCNVTARTIPLGGYTLGTASGDLVLPTADLASGGCATVCASSLDACTVTADVVLEPGGDTVRVSVEDVVLDSVTLDASWGWVTGTVFSLDPAFLGAETNDSREAWCLTDGSPGSPNPACP